MDYLNRHGAPFEPELWDRIQEAAVEAARSLLTGRRFLQVDGPYGLGLTAIEIGNDDFCRETGPGEAAAVVSRAISLPMLRKIFRLSNRRIAAARELGHPLDLSPVQEAAEALAAREEEFVYYGQRDFGLQGLLTATGSPHLDLGDWRTVDQALQDVVEAVNRLDEGGFRGPYALVLSPRLYNSLYRRYENTVLLQVEHLRRLCSVGVFKAPIQGGAVVDPRVGRIVVGLDLHAGFERHDGIHHHLYLTESLVLRVEEPGAVCVLNGSLARTEDEPARTAPPVEPETPRPGGGRRRRV